MNTLTLTTQQQNSLNDLRHGDSPNGDPRQAPDGAVLIDCETGTVRIELDGTLTDGDASSPSVLRVDGQAALADAERASGERDACTVHVPDWTATTILNGSGWQQGSDGEWIRPNGRSRADGGRSGRDFYWMRDEALMVALDTVALGLISTVGE